MTSQAPGLSRQCRLPGPPSAAEIAENTVAPGEMHAKLLHKVEAFTLDMHESMQAMRQRIDSPDAENQRMKRHVAGLLSRGPQ